VVTRANAATTAKNPVFITQEYPPFPEHAPAGTTLEEGSGVAALSTVRSAFGGGDELKMVSPDCEMTWRTRLVIQAKRSLPDDQPTSWEQTTSRSACA
jgi:hypothetical protein